MKNPFQPMRVGSTTKASGLLSALALLLILTPSSQATLVGLIPTPPDSTVLAGATTDGPGTLLDDMKVSFAFTTTAGTTSGTLESAVYRASGGTLDFYYQVVNSAASAVAIARETNTAFTGFTTDTGFRIEGSQLTGTKFSPVPTFVDGTVAPIFADRNASVQPGQTSNVLVIATDSPQFEPGMPRD